MPSLNAQWLKREAKQMRHDGKAHWAVHTMASQMEQAADEIDRLQSVVAGYELLYGRMTDG